MLNSEVSLLIPYFKKIYKTFVKLKALENPNCKNDFEKVEIKYLTLFCAQLQITDEAFYALPQKKE